MRKFLYTLVGAVCLVASSAIADDYGIGIGFPHTSPSSYLNQSAGSYSQISSQSTLQRLEDVRKNLDAMEQSILSMTDQRIKTKLLAAEFSKLSSELNQLTLALKRVETKGVKP